MIESEYETRLSAFAVSEKRIREKRKGVERRGVESSRVEAKRSARCVRHARVPVAAGPQTAPNRSHHNPRKVAQSNRVGRRLSANSGTRRTAARTRRPADTRSAGRALPTPAAAARTPAATESVVHNHCITWNWAEKWTLGSIIRKNTFSLLPLRTENSEQKLVIPLKAAAYQIKSAHNAIKSNSTRTSCECRLLMRANRRFSARWWWCASARRKAVESSRFKRTKAIAKVVKDRNASVLHVINISLNDVKYSYRYTVQYCFSPLRRLLMRAKRRFSISSSLLSSESSKQIQSRRGVQTTNTRTKHENIFLEGFNLKVMCSTWETFANASESSLFHIGILLIVAICKKTQIDYLCQCNSSSYLLILSKYSHKSQLIRKVINRRSGVERNLRGSVCWCARIGASRSRRRAAGRQHRRPLQHSVHSRVSLF